MSKKCFVVYGKGVGYGSDNGYYYENIYCADTVIFQRESSNPYTGNTPWDRLIIDGVPASGDGYYAGSGSIVVVSDYPLADQYCPNPRGARNGNCDTCLLPHINYDCINGVCTPNVNGFYSSLSVCQTACGKQGCSGQCISSSDWAQIEGLISQLKNRSCA